MRYAPSSGERAPKGHYLCAMAISSLLPSFPVAAWTSAHLTGHAFCIPPLLLPFCLPKGSSVTWGQRISKGSWAQKQTSLLLRTHTHANPEIIRSSCSDIYTTISYNFLTQLSPTKNTNIERYNHPTPPASEHIRFPRPPKFRTQPLLVSYPMLAHEIAILEKRTPSASAYPPTFSARLTPTPNDLSPQQQYGSAKYQYHGLAATSPRNSNTMAPEQMKVGREPGRRPPIRNPY